MKRYFRHDSESRLGEGTTWLEFDGEYATRQVERYGDRWFSSRRDYEPEIGGTLYDQTLALLKLTPDEEVPAEEFERVWNEAERACR